MKKRLLLLPLLAGLALTGCGKDKDNGSDSSDPGSDVVVDAVISVEIKGSVVQLNLYGELQLSAEVTTTGNANNLVAWSSNDSTVATVSSSGLVTPKKVGNVTITATSKFDSSKSSSVTIEIVDKGFDPSFIAEGFEYVQEFPVSAIKEFLGEGSYEVFKLEDLVGGAYFKKLDASATGAECIKVAVGDARDVEYAGILDEAGFSRIYVNSNDQYEAVDPTGKYTVAFGSEFDYGTFSYVGPTTFYFYKSADVWGSSKLTTDVAWDEEKIQNKEAEEIALAKEYLSNVAFVALGEEYEISYEADYSELEELLMLLEMFGFIDETTPDEEIMEWLEDFGYTGPSYYLSIYDYSLAEVFDGYADALEAAGYKFKEEYDEEYEETYSYYELADGFDAYFLNFTFGEQGNEIMVQKGNVTFDAFPTELINGFIENVLGSENRVIAYEETEGALFSGAIIPDGEDGPECDLVMDYATIEQLQAYALKLEEAGFEVEYDDGDGKYYPGWEATKGKLVIYFYLEQVEDEDTEEYLDEGAVYFFVYADESKHEAQGIYLPETMSALLGLGGFDLDLEVVKLEDPTFNVVSSEPTVATVEGLTVTPVAVGQTTITVTIPETEFEASVVLTVTDKSEFSVAMEDVNAWLVLNECQPVEFPDIIDATILEGSGYDSEEDYWSFGMSGTVMTPEIYAASLKELGFEVFEDEEGDPLCSNGEVVVSVYEYYDLLVIDIYLAEEEGAGATFDFTEGGYDVSGGNGVFAYSTAKGSGSSNPATCSDTNDFKELRLYDKNTLTISSESSITSVEIICNECSDSKAGAELTCSTGTLSETATGYLWTGDATSVTFTCKRVGSGDKGKQCHIQTIVVNGGGSGGGGGGSSTDIETALEDIQDITVDIAAAYLGKSASQITVGYGKEDGVDVYVWDYSDDGFICSDFTVEPTGNETSDLSKMKAALPNGAKLDSYNTYEKDDYHDIWYTYGDYSIGIYYYDGDASFAVVPTEMLEIYFTMMYGE